MKKGYIEERLSKTICCFREEGTKKDKLAYLILWKAHIIAFDFYLDLFFSR